MNVRQAAAVLLVGVFGSTLAYGVFFDGEFSEGGRLPSWVAAGALLAAAGVSATLLWWVRRVKTSATAYQAGADHNNLVLIIGALGVLIQGLGIATEVAIGAPTVWLIPVISVVVYSGFVLWLLRRASGAEPGQAEA